MSESSGAQFETHADAVYAWAYRLLGQHHDALDVVQDVFLRWNRQCEIDPPAEPKSWLRRVTLNRVIDAFRRSRKEATVPVSVQLREPKVKRALDRLDQEMLRGDIAGALEQLTDAQRGVLIAKVYDGLTFSEIARELDVAVSTAKTHYVRAVCAVRDRLERRWA